MNIRNWLLLGLALVLALTLTVGLPGGSQAQQKHPAASYGPAGQNNASGYYTYNGSGYAYCPMGPGYGYSPPANRNYRNNGSRTWGQGYQGAWCPWNSGYARGYRGGWGCR
jgi:hypothetical protein